MTGALSHKSEDHVGFKWTPGSVLMILGVLWIRMASFSLLLSSKTKISDSSHLILCPVLLTWTEMALWASLTLMVLLCSDILIFKVRPVLQLLNYRNQYLLFSRKVPVFQSSRLNLDSIRRLSFIISSWYINVELSNKKDIRSSIFLQLSCADH